MSSQHKTSGAPRNHNEGGHSKTLCNLLAEILDGGHNVGATLHDGNLHG